MSVFKDHGLWGRVGYSPANDIARIFFALMKVVLIFLLKANTISLFSLCNVCFVQKMYKENGDKKLDKMFSGLGRS